MGFAFFAGIMNPVLAEVVYPTQENASEIAEPKTFLALALPRSVKHWSLTTLREKLIKIGAKVVRHSGYVIFQMAEVAVPREVFATILERIQRLGVPPPLLQRG